MNEFWNWMEDKGYTDSADLGWWIDYAIKDDKIYREDYDKYSELQLKIRQIYSNSQEFTILKNYKESNQIKDHKLARQLEILYNSYLENQIEADLLKEIVDSGTEVEKKFSTFRGSIDGKKVTVNEIEGILKSDLKSVNRKKCMACKEFGK